MKTIINNKIYDTDKCELLPEINAKVIMNGNGKIKWKI